MTAPNDDTAARSAHPRARWIRFAVSAACLGAVGWWLGTQPAPQFPTSARGLAFLLAAAALTLIHAVVRGYRWQEILHAAAPDHPTGAEPYYLSAVGYMGNTVLPARGGDVMRVGLLSRRRGIDWRTVTGSLVPERMLDVLTLAVLLVLLGIAGGRDSPLGAWAIGLAGGGVVVVLAGIFIYHELRVRGYLQGVADRIRPFTQPTRRLAGRRAFALAALSLALWCSEGIVLWLVGQSTGAPLDYIGAVLVVVLASFATAIPAAPGFVGTFDAAVIVGLHAAGVPSADTVALSLLYRAVLFAPTTIAGLIILVARYGGLATIRRRNERGDGAPAGPAGADAAALLVADDQELLAEQPPQERRAEVPARQRR